jgi:hypothetical protein
MQQRRALVITLVVAVLVFGLETLALWKVHAKLLDAEVAKRKDVIAQEVRANAAAITPEVMGAWSSEGSKAAFTVTYHALQSPRVIRFKVWTVDRVVAWSNLSEIIGQHFADNEEVGEAVDEGNPVMSIEMPSETESEHVSERNFEALTETYIPLKDASGKVYGVLELYEPASVVQQPAQAALLAYALPLPAITLAVFVWAFARVMKKKSPLSPKARRA